jgi:endogenous inhibitor of DNA gyrase (YacG/DUF329 family)
MIDGCPGTQKFKQPQPEEIKCPLCGREVEIWTDEFQVECPKCKKQFSRGGQSCLDWCKGARECVGEEIYARYVENKKKKGC